MSHIIRKRERQVELTKNPNEKLVNGRVQEGTPETYTISVAVFPMTSEMIQDYEGGNYTTQDKKVYVRENLEASDGTAVQVENNDVLTIDDDVLTTDDDDYEIRENTPWTDHSDFKTFVAKKKVVE